MRIPRQEIADYERRLEYWDAATEIAMICEPVSVYHEHPGQRLRELTPLIALTRGSPIETFGSADLLVRDARGAHLRIMQADQTVYLRPRATRPWGPAIEVGSDVLPDVVLEVDNTTDDAAASSRHWCRPLECRDEEHLPRLVAYLADSGGSEIATKSRGSATIKVGA